MPFFFISFFFPTSSFSFFPWKKSCGHLAFWSALTIPTTRPNQNILPVCTKTAKTLFFCFWLDSYSALSVNQFVCISLTFCLNWLVCLGVWGVMSCVMEPKYGVCGVQRLLAAHNLYSEQCWLTDVAEALNITNQNWFLLLTYLTKWASFRFIVIFSSTQIMHGGLRAVSNFENNWSKVIWFLFMAYYKQSF